MKGDGGGWKGGEMKPCSVEAGRDPCSWSGTREWLSRSGGRSGQTEDVSIKWAPVAIDSTR